MTWLLNRIYNFYSTELPSYLQALFVAGTGFIAWVYSRSQWEGWLWLAGAFWAALLLVAIVRILIGIRYRSLRLFLHRHTGILYDKRFALRNISLRARTIAFLLNGLTGGSGDQKYEIGVKVGGSFYLDFSNGCRTLEGIDFDGMALAKRVKRWTSYDSSSGMGKFVCSISNENPLRADVTVFNAFTTHEDTDQGTCRFLSGYLAGFFSAMSKKEVLCHEVQCQKQSDACKFELREKT